MPNKFSMFLTLIGLGSMVSAKDNDPSSAVSLRGTSDGIDSTVTHVGQDQSITTTLAPQFPGTEYTISTESINIETDIYGTTKIRIPSDLLKLAQDIIPVESLHDSDRGRRLADVIADPDGFKTTPATAKLIKKHLDAFQRFRTESSKVHSIDANSPVLKDIQFFTITGPKTKAELEAQLNFDSKIIGETTLELLEQQQFRIDVSELSLREKKSLVKKFTSFGYLVLPDIKTNLSDLSTDYQTPESIHEAPEIRQLRGRLNAAANELGIMTGHCMWIFDSCSYSAKDWQNFGFNAAQFIYNDQICTPGYSTHGAASVYSALIYSPLSRVYFRSVFDASGGGFLALTLSAYQAAMKQLAAEQLKGFCLDYASTSLSGATIYATPDTPAVGLEIYKSLTFDFSAEAAGNGQLNADDYVCRYMHASRVLQDLKSAAGGNYRGPFNVITAYVNAQTGNKKSVVIPSYANMQVPPKAPTASDACISFMTETEIPIPDGIYSSSSYGGTSASTATANGLVNAIAAELKKNGLEYDQPAIYEFLVTIGKEYTAAGWTFFPYTAGWNTIAIPSPGLPTVNMDNILAGIEKLLNSPPGTYTSAPTPKVTSSPTRATDAPTRATDSPTRATESPTRATDSPTRVTDSPTRATNSPTRVTDSPTRATDSPTRVTDSPTRATDSPTRATASPIKSTTPKPTAASASKVPTTATRYPTQRPVAPSTSPVGKPESSISPSISVESSFSPSSAPITKISTVTAEAGSNDAAAIAGAAVAVASLIAAIAAAKKFKICDAQYQRAKAQMQARREAKKARKEQQTLAISAFSSSSASSEESRVKESATKFALPEAKEASIVRPSVEKPPIHEPKIVKPTVTRPLAPISDTNRPVLPFASIAPSVTTSPPVVSSKQDSLSASAVKTSIPTNTSVSATRKIFETQQASTAKSTATKDAPGFKFDSTTKTASQTRSIFKPEIKSQAPEKEQPTLSVQERAAAFGGVKPATTHKAPIVPKINTTSDKPHKKDDSSWIKPKKPS